MGRNDDNNNAGRRGRHGRGNDRGGRGRGRTQGRSNWNYEKTPEMKFYPHGSGKKGQTVTFATVKDHILSLIHI